MKRNIKKLAILVIITAMALFIMVDMASAGSSGRRAIRGEYAYTGETTCLISPIGFDDKLQPVGGWGIIQTSSREGDIRFELNGTGSAYMFSRNITLPYQWPTSLPGNPFGASTMDITFDFTYTLEKDGTITIILDTVGEGVFTSKPITGPDAGLTFTITGVSPDGSITPIVNDGVITPDGKTITLNAGAPDVYKITRSDGKILKSICRSSGVLIWVRDHADHHCDRD
jgi:hypothetical protein